MKERPIIFSDAMVRAILEGRKTQTRRKVKPQPPAWANYQQQAGDGWDWTDRNVDADDLRHWPDYYKPMPCPYGQPGDRLWVRESGWERPERTAKMMREGADTWPRFAYAADPWTDQDKVDFTRWGFRSRSPIHMPRWASRITLEVTGVRVERVQDISEADAIAEGALRFDSRTTFISELGTQSIYIPSMGYGRDAYRRLWDSINGPGSWAANPWVWVLEFRRVS